ncbi:hypothetical protein J2T02_003460 [Chitinophaga terrae (ex Kim and Jung 2007)]|uniref:hypothetical protein n=1 Tax=Chitinophaga terrae (ex Kim and Jung 2007) TaxID=408074 RepID=UPI002789E09B|nr:hypothetical protein [Chitinophaga terrae (ex Kim and Jung 2007)]MDQ0108332.1 hypothetical protein [Chitinophaga terrae (ex Kim and Jung 2007)]
MKTILIACSMLLAATLLSVTPATAKTTSVANAPAKAWKPMVMKPLAIVTKSYYFNFNYAPYNPGLKVSLSFDDTDYHLVDGTIQANSPGTFITYQSVRTLTPNASTNVRYVEFFFQGNITILSISTTYTIQGMWHRDDAGNDHWFLMRNTI